MFRPARRSSVDGARAGYVGPAGLSPRDGTPPAIRDLVVAPAAFNPTLGAGATISAAASKAVVWSVSVLGPAGNAWLEANRQRSVGLAATQQWQTIVSEYDKEGTRPAPATVNTVEFTRMAGLLNAAATCAAVETPALRLMVISLFVKS